MMLRIFACALAVANMAYLAHAASFDCSKAQRPVEKIICGSPKLNTADEALGRVYRDALSKLSSTSVGLLRADQVQWLAWVQQVCRTDQPHTPPAAAVTCLLPVYSERTKHLRTAVVRHDGFSFLTRTQYLAEPEKDSDGKGSPEHPGFGTLQASWPVSDSNDPKWIAWNKAMEVHAFLMAGSVDAKQPAPQDPVWTTSLAEAQDSTVIGQIKGIEHGRITSSLNIETMGHGAAHPSEAFETLTWMFDDQRALQENDVFAAGSAWKHLVAAACWKALQTGDQKSYIYTEVTGPDARPLQDVVANTGNWTLEPDGFHISYPEYSVAPRVAPVDDTVIPWIQLKPVLAPGFAAP